MFRNSANCTKYAFILVGLKHMSNGRIIITKILYIAAVLKIYLVVLTEKNILLLFYVIYLHCVCIIRTVLFQFFFFFSFFFCEMNSLHFLPCVKACYSLPYSFVCAFLLLHWWHNTFFSGCYHNIWSTVFVRGCNVHGTDHELCYFSTFAACIRSLQWHWFIKYTTFFFLLW